MDLLEGLVNEHRLLRIRVQQGHPAHLTCGRVNVVPLTLDLLSVLQSGELRADLDLLRLKLRFRLFASASAIIHKLSRAQSHLPLPVVDLFKENISIRFELRANRSQLIDRSHRPVMFACGTARANLRRN